MSVKTLDHQTACKLNYYKVNSLEESIRALIKNSLEASAKNIAVRIDLNVDNVRFQVIDDGNGIYSEDLNVIGKNHWSNKKQKTGKGQTLAILRRTCKFLTVASRNQDDTFTVTFEKGVRIEKKLEHQTRKCKGTTVTISGMMWNLKIRRKSIRVAIAIVKLKRIIQSFAFLHPDVKFSLRNDSHECKDILITTERGYSTKDRVIEIFGKGTNMNLDSHEINWQGDNNCNITGIIFKQSHHNDTLQFMCLNSQPVFQRDILKYANSRILKYLRNILSVPVDNHHAMFVLFLTMPDELLFNTVIENCFIVTNNDLQEENEKDEGSSLEGFDKLSSNPFGDGVHKLGYIHSNQYPANTPCKPFGRISLRASISNQCYRNPEQAGLTNWQNPQFKYFKEINQFPLITKVKEGENVKLSRSLFEHLIVGQVDKKYILSIFGDTVLLFDQHAVHERINLEYLTKDWNTKHHLLTPITVKLATFDMALSQFYEVSRVFSKWGLEFAFASTEEPSTLIVESVPRAFKQAQTEVMVDLCTELFTEILNLSLMGEAASYPTIPKCVHNFLATKACRGSIMFGQHLTLDTCQQLMRDLALCGAPFQCAHGRPSVHVLCNANITRENKITNSKPDWSRLHHSL